MHCVESGSIFSLIGIMDLSLLQALNLHKISIIAQQTFIQNFKLLEPPLPQYDWANTQRWNISYYRPSNLTPSVEPELGPHCVIGMNRPLNFAGSNQAFFKARRTYRVTMGAPEDDTGTPAKGEKKMHFCETNSSLFRP